jgi:hypothetical protein
VNNVVLPAPFAAMTALRSPGHDLAQDAHALRRTSALAAPGQEQERAEGNAVADRYQPKPPVKDQAAVDQTAVIACCLIDRLGN